MTAAKRSPLPLLIAACAILPFLPALNAPFLNWDDAGNLVENLRWRGFTAANLRWMLTTTHGGPYMPLSWLSYALDFTLWGADPAAMRATNLLLHAASAVLLFGVVETLIEKAAPAAAAGERAAAAAFAAIFWAVHPLRVESVVWLTERRDCLSGFFYLLALLLYVRKPERPLPPLLAYCAAVLSKASVITLPVTLLLLDRWPLRRRGAWLEKLPYFAISIAAGVVGLFGQKDNAALKGLAASGPGERIALSVYSAWWYAAKTVAPFGLSPYHRVPSGFGLATPAVWAAAAALAAAAVLLWAVRRREAAPGQAFLHYAVALAPMAGLARFGHHLVAERYSYLPGMSLSALAGGAFLVLRGRPERKAAAAALLLAFGGLAAKESSHWRGSEALWRRVLAVDPGTNLARINLASYYRSAGRTGEALAQEREAVALDPTLGEELNNLGADAEGRGDHAEAERLLRAAIKARPELAKARYNLAATLTSTGRGREALVQLEAAARLDPSDGTIANNLGLARLAQGKLDAGAGALRRATELRPDWAVARYNLGYALTLKGARLEAAAAFDEAARLDPRMAQAWINGGNEYARMGRLKDAESRYRRALEAEPRNELARRNLEELRRAMGGPAR